MLVLKTTSNICFNLHIINVIKLLTYIYFVNVMDLYHSQSRQDFDNLYVRRNAILRQIYSIKVIKMTKLH